MQESPSDENALLDVSATNLNEEVTFVLSFPDDANRRLAQDAEQLSIGKERISAARES